MSAVKKTVAAGLAALTLGTATIAASSPAEAWWRYGWGAPVAAGVLGGLAAGAIIGSAAEPGRASQSLADRAAAPDRPARPSGSRPTGGSSPIESRQANGLAALFRSSTVIRRSSEDDEPWRDVSRRRSYLPGGVQTTVSLST